MKFQNVTLFLLNIIKGLSRKSSFKVKLSHYKVFCAVYLKYLLKIHLKAGFYFKYKIRRYLKQRLGYTDRTQMYKTR